MNAKIHISLGLTLLLVTLLLGALALGIVPDRQQAVRDGRTQLAEALAISGSAMVTQAELRRLGTTLSLVVDRNDDLLSAGVRRSDGHLLAGVANHVAGWEVKEGDHSTLSQVVVPIWSGGKRWGQVELRFRPLRNPGFLGWLTDPRVGMVAFLAAGSFALFYLYLRKMLQHLDPSQAVPPHVRSALDTLAEGLLIMDMKEQIVLANRSIAHFVGHEADELMGVRAGRLPWVTADGTALSPAEFPWRRALQDAEPRVNDIILLRDSDGDLRTFIANCSPVLGTSGSPGGVLVSLDDVTQLEEHKAELSIAKEEADAANKAKSEFLAHMSHEIRTPINAILGFTEVLKRGHVTDARDRNSYLETIRSSGEHLLQLINDVLDLSKVESGHIEIEQIRFAAHETVRNVVTVLSVKAHEKNVALDFDVEGPVPETVLSDPTRLRQIVTNLVSNAVKFTDEGEVRVVMSADGGRLVVRVSDTGIGLPESAYESIFDEFIQADSSVTRRFGGTGLGLPISRHFAHMLGGDITVASVVGEGTTFTATIDAGPMDGIRMLEPAEAIAAASGIERSDEASWQFPPARILVVDDSEENRELMQVVLSDVGLRVEGAENGQLGVDMATSGDVDLILMDMQMPVMDGYQATARLRELGFDKPIIALTANAMKGFEEKCLAAGCDGYLTKPIEIEKLLASFAEYLGGTRTAPEATRVHTAVPAMPPLVSSLAATNPRIGAILARFKARLLEKTKVMQSAWEARDYDDLAAQAHWLKGSAGTVGYDAFRTPAEALELFARDRSDREIEAVLREIRSLAGRIEEAPGTMAPDATLQPGQPAETSVEMFALRLEEKLGAMESCFDRHDSEQLAGLANWLGGSAALVGLDAFSAPARNLENLAKEAKWSEIEHSLHELRCLADGIESTSRGLPQ